MRSTIKDVAKLAGVSPATVSLVLNKKPVSIAEKTKAAVQKAALELNYRPNQLAVGLATNRTYSLGLIVPDVSNPFFSALTRAIEQAAMLERYAVITGNTDDDCETTCRFLQLFSDHHVDGIVLSQSDFQNPEETIKIKSMLKEIHIPIVFIDRVYEGMNISAVQVDQRMIGYIATQHLLEMGHTKIACVTGPLGLYNTQKRLSGYKQALSEWQIPLDDAMIFEGKYSIHTGAEAIPYILGKKATAVFCFDDFIAFGAYKEMNHLNRSIPDDLSIVSIDDTILDDIVQPPLTSVSQPIAQIAKLAVGTLVSQIDNPDAAINTKLPKLEPTLKVRGSVKRLK